jgi:hypothetical protein
MERSLPARFPAGDVWPAEMRADMVAAYLDLETTGKLLAAVARSEAPRPTATRLFNGRRIPVWARVECDTFIERRHGVSAINAANDNDPTFNAAELL